jgi:hypothetical protein
MSDDQHTASTAHSVDDFHAFLNQNPEWTALSAKRDEARKLWSDRSDQAYQMILASHYSHAAEILEDRTVMYYQSCMDDDASNAIHQWTGINPELSVEIYAQVVSFVRDKAHAIYQEISEYKAETKRLEQEYDKAQAVVSRLYGQLRQQFSEFPRPNQT